MRRCLAMAAVAVLLGACASTGTKVDQAALSGFERGKTTYTEVVTALGAPSQDAVNADGARQVIYSYAQATMRPETFIPYIGPLVGGMDTKSTAVVLKFDRAGILQDYVSTTGAQGTGMGFAAH